MKNLENVLMKFVMGLEFYDEEGQRKIAIGEAPAPWLSRSVVGGWCGCARAAVRSGQPASGPRRGGP